MLGVHKSVERDFGSRSMFGKTERKPMNCHNPRVRDFNIVASTHRGTHRLLKVLFGSDGSIYVTFPGASACDGIAAPLTITPDEQYYNINNTAWQTGHIVKFAHHASGEALFSLTSKVNTVVRRQSTPLSNLSGTLFMMQIQDLRSFLRPRKKTRAHDLVFSPCQNSFVLCCRRAPLATLLAEHLSYCASPCKGQPFDEYALTFYVLPKKTKKARPHFVFCAGFDAETDPARPQNSAEAHELLLIYPWTDLKRPDGTDLPSLDRSHESMKTAGQSAATPPLE